MSEYKIDSDGLIAIILKSLEMSARIEQLEQQNKQMRELLKEVEWFASGDNWPTLYCPFCGWHRNNGHSDDCKLGNLLKETERE